MIHRLVISRHLPTSIAVVFLLGFYCPALCSKPIETSKPTRKSLSKDELAYGELQLRSMLTDRPRMMTYVSIGDPVWSWIIRQFAGEAVGTKIKWSRESPNGQSIADHIVPRRGRSGAIRIRTYDAKGRVLGGEEMWMAATFELFNIRNAPEFIKVTDDAYAGVISKDEYVYQNMRLEFKASRSQRVFFESIWLPHLRALGLKSNETCWPRHITESDEELFQHEKALRSYNYCYWSDGYSKTIAPYLSSRERIRQKP